jgi:ABC-type sulfate transport system permease component
VFVFNRLQSGDRAGAAAVAVVLLTISFALLLAVGGIRRWATRYERA